MSQWPCRWDCEDDEVGEGSTCSLWGAWNIMKLMTGILSILNSLWFMGLKGTFTHLFFLKTCRASILSFFCCRALLFQWKLLNYRPQKGVAPSFLSVSSLEVMEEVIHSPVTQGFECQLQDVGLSLLNESFFLKLPEWVVLTLWLVDRYRTKIKRRIWWFASCNLSSICLSPWRHVRDFTPKASLGLGNSPNLTI